MKKIDLEKHEDREKVAQALPFYRAYKNACIIKKEIPMSFGAWLMVEGIPVVDHGEPQKIQ